MYKANDAGVKELNKMYLKHKEEYYAKNGIELKITPEAYYDLIRRNIGIAGREIVSFLAFAGLVVAASALLPKKDDPDWENAQGYFSFMKRVINRCEDEFELFFNPLSFAKFGSGSTFPVLSGLGTTIHLVTHAAKYGYGVIMDDDVDNQHVLPYFFQTLPGGNIINIAGEVVAPSEYKEATGKEMVEKPQGSY